MLVEPNEEEHYFEEEFLVVEEQTSKLTTMGSIGGSFQQTEGLHEFFYSINQEYRRHRLPPHIQYEIGQTSRLLWIDTHSRKIIYYFCYWTECIARRFLLKL